MITSSQFEKARRKALNEIASTLTPAGSLPYRNWEDFKKRCSSANRVQLIGGCVSVALRAMKEEIL